MYMDLRDSDVFLMIYRVRKRFLLQIEWCKYASSLLLIKSPNLDSAIWTRDVRNAYGPIRQVGVEVSHNTLGAVCMALGTLEACPNRSRISVL
jgi:hypothetical protein